MGAHESTPAEPPAVEAPAEASEPRPVLTDESTEHDARSRLLPREAIGTLASRLQSDERARWRLLFDSSQHGQSFNRFLKHVLGKGSTIVVVRTTAGDIVGGYAPESWAKGPKFHGGYSCFLFRVTPSDEPDGANTEVYTASGVNRNFMYCNDGMAELPNGFAFGGQPGHFGLWLHAGLDTGESSGLCSSFDGQLFAQHTRFSVDTVEVWATRDEPPPVTMDEDEAQAADGGNSVLQKRKLDKDFMAMARGSTFASDNI